MPETLILPAQAERLVRGSALRNRARAAGRRVAPGFVAALEEFCQAKLTACLATRDGGKKTLDAALARYVLFGGR